MPAYAVYHQSVESIKKTRRIKEKLQFPTDYELVAIIEAPNADAVWTGTNHIEEPWHEHRCNRQGDLVVLRNDRPRSSMVGDVFIDLDNNIMHKVASCGFKSQPVVALVDTLYSEMAGEEGKS